MRDEENVIREIFQAFAANSYPGDNYLQGSFDGCEPAEEVGPFQSQSNWPEIEPDFLDAHASALSFFSEAGFRFFLPAYLVADMRGQLRVADPLFHLTHGFSSQTVEVPTPNRSFLLQSGKSALINPRRYGAITFFDYACYRLSVFTREEAGAIVVYLQYQLDSTTTTLQREPIEAALTVYWLERARTAHTREMLEQYLSQQREFLAATRAGI